MLPYLICGGLVAAGATLLGKTFVDYQDYRRRFGPWPFWTYRGRRINRGQTVYFPETRERVKFTGRCVYIRDRWGQEERFVINRVDDRNGQSYADIKRL